MSKGEIINNDEMWCNTINKTIAIVNIALI
jgi:hypothetical protein